MDIKFLFIVVFISLLILPLVSADIITPGFHSIDIENRITNLQDYPNYVFVSAGSISTMCPIKVISQEGLIEPYYKLCSISVYAIEKEKFDENILNATEIPENAKVVITGIQTLKSVSSYSSETLVNNIYTVDLNAIKDKPDNTITESNYLREIVVIAVFFVLTVLIEFLVVLVFNSISSLHKSNLKLLGYVSLINLITLPIATLIVINAYSILLVELIVVLVESLMLKYLLKIDYPRALVISFIANLITGFMGIFLSIIASVI